mgnify:CR=1 FL=1
MREFAKVSLGIYPTPLYRLSGVSAKPVSYTHLTLPTIA